jgi:hypothetical protein
VKKEHLAFDNARLRDELEVLRREYDHRHRQRDQLLGLVARLERENEELTLKLAKLEAACEGK